MNSGAFCKSMERKCCRFDCVRHCHGDLDLYTLLACERTTSACSRLGRARTSGSESMAATASASTCHDFAAMRSNLQHIVAHEAKAAPRALAADAVTQGFEHFAYPKLVRSSNP